MRKGFLFLVLLVLLLSSLFAVSFGYHVLDVRTSPDFGKGVFPTSLEYQFNFPMPGETTLLTFRLDNGLDFRTIAQDPDSGKLLAKYKDISQKIPVKDYSALFDEFKLLFKQGFGKTSFSDNSLVALSFAFGGRFELAFESLSWMSDKDHTVGLFWTDAEKKENENGKKERFSSFVGAPELEGDRSITNTFLDFGLDVDLMRDDYVVKNGVRLSSLLRLCLDWIPLNDGSAKYIASINSLSLAYTPVAIVQNNEKDLHWFSLTMGNDLTYRFISGNKVPYYIQGGDIFSYRGANTEHVITNRTYMTLFGPQIVVKDLYPSLDLFHDFVLSFGSVLNMENPDKIAEYAGVLGLRAEFNLYNISKFFYEVGMIYTDQFDHERKNIEARFGFTLEI